MVDPFLLIKLPPNITESWLPISNILRSNTLNLGLIRDFCGAKCTTPSLVANSTLLLEWNLDDGGSNNNNNNNDNVILIVVDIKLLWNDDRCRWM